jgi:phenylacetate-CoA ligase
MNNQIKLASELMRRWEGHSLARRIYNASPWFMQNIFVSSYGWILLRRLTSPAVKQQLSYYLKTQWLSKEDLADLQMQKLRSLIYHVYQNVPYYRQVMDRLKLKPEHIRELSDLNKMPLLSKQDIRQNLDALYARNMDRKKLNAMATSGTTGSPLVVYVTSRNAVTERALNLRMRRWAGWHVDQKRATFSGYPLVPQGKQKLPLWRYDLPEKRLFLSPYHMTNENMGDYLQVLRGFEPKVIESYPSYLSFLAQYLARTNQAFRVQAVFTSSETLFPHQRQIIEERFQTRVFDWYGLTERAASAAQCECTNGYHVNAEKTIVEIVKADGELAIPEESGEIIGTNLEEYGMPLIRYRSGDMSAYRAESCPCGRALPLIEQIQTRVDDMIMTSDGRFINPAPLAGLFRSPKIERGRIIQEDAHNFVVQIMPATGCDEVDTEPILKGIQSVVGSDATISIQVVNEITSLPSGKYPFVVSKVYTKIKGESDHGRPISIENSR